MDQAGDFGGVHELGSSGWVRLTGHGEETTPVCGLGVGEEVVPPRPHWCKVVPLAAPGRPPTRDQTEARYEPTRIYRHSGGRPPRRAARRPGAAGIAGLPDRLSQLLGVFR